jgi:predicted ATPase
MRSDYLFGPHQLSDGTLRFMALATLLLQPAELMPKVIVLDEPELGLHPAALQLLAGLFQRASAHCQLIIATQSVELVNQFSVNDLIIADRHPLEGFTTLHRPSETEFADWLTEYTTGELWQKNLLGGRP